MRVATWNVENLFRPGADSGPPDQAAYEAKLAALADVIRGLDPDVLAVQEVGDPEALGDLAARVGGRWHSALADPDGRGIRVGYLSRLELTQVEQVSDFPAGLQPVQVDDTAPPATRMGRPALRARVQAPTASGGRLAVDLLTCHLKSKLLTFPGGRFHPRDEDQRARYAHYALARRSAEAVTVRAAATRLLAAGQDAALVVLGDLNDVPEAATTQLLLGPPGSEIGTRGFDVPDQGDPQRLWNLAPRIRADQRYSRTFRGRRELIDHILVSHALVHRVADGDVHTGPHRPAINHRGPDRPTRRPGQRPPTRPRRDQRLNRAALPRRRPPPRQQTAPAPQPTRRAPAAVRRALPVSVSARRRRPARPCSESGPGR